MPKKTGLLIYLASQSKRRRDLLRAGKIPFRIVPSSYREKSSRFKAGPGHLVIEHALGKARNARLPRKKIPGVREIVLGADTVVWFRSRALGKPKDLEAARRLLLEMSGKIHWVYTGIALIDRKTGREKTAFEKTRVRFKRWGDREIGKYLAAIDPLDKAGAYAIQARPCIVAAYAGSYTNVIGLPCERLRRLLRLF